MKARRVLVALAVLPLLASACSDDGGSGTAATPTTEASEVTAAPATTEAPTATASPGDGPMMSIDAPGGVSIAVDGDASDWADVPGLDLTLKPIVAEHEGIVEPRLATVKVANDGTNAYLLFQVEDDLNFSTETPHLSGAMAAQWAIHDGAGTAMGATDGDRNVSLGLVDIWHWELDCGSGVTAGGSVSDAGGKSPGNDGACNFDDEYASETETREDDDSASAENSLTGVWSHTASAEDADGVWTFEMSRPMKTGDAQDAQFVNGQTSKLALAYWDADVSSEGWDDDSHVITALDGWIEVNWGGEATPAVAPANTVSVDAPGGVSIAVDGDASDWADVSGVDVTLKPITGEDVEPHTATIKVANDGTNAYLLFQVDDDLNFSTESAHLSGAMAAQWAIDAGAGTAMGAIDGDRNVSLGLVDIWHWELDCGSGVTAGGSVSDAGGKSPGNDGACNFDDEYASETETREDDDSASAENSLTGVWSHTASAEDADGVWTFEMSRPMKTGDAQDAQFAAGESSQLALAYWDADGSADGWEDDTHVVTALDGWITVNWK